MYCHVILVQCSLNKLMFAYYSNKAYQYVSLNMVVLNCRDHYENVWLPDFFFALLKTTLQQAVAKKPT